MRSLPPPSRTSGNPVARENGRAFGVEAANHIIFLRTGDGRGGAGERFRAGDAAGAVAPNAPLIAEHSLFTILRVAGWRHTDRPDLDHPVRPRSPFSRHSAHPSTPLSSRRSRPSGRHGSPAPLTCRRGRRGSSPMRASCRCSGRCRPSPCGAASDIDGPQAPGCSPQSIRPSPMEPAQFGMRSSRNCSGDRSRRSVSQTIRYWTTGRRWSPRRRIRIGRAGCALSSGQRAW